TFGGEYGLGTVYFRNVVRAVSTITNGHTARRRKRQAGRHVTINDPADGGVSREEGFGFRGGVPTNNTPFFCQITEAHAVSGGVNIGRRIRAAGRLLLPAARLLVLRDRRRAGREGPAGGG